jgi:hypothetical protein
MTAVDESHADVSAAQPDQCFDRTPRRIIVVAMLLLFAAMLFGLAAFDFFNAGLYPLSTLLQGIAWLCGIAWLPCLSFGIVLCAQNPRPPR